MESEVGDVGSYKMDVFAKLTEFIKNTAAFNTMQTTEPSPGQPRVKAYPQHPLSTHIFFSCDIREANYTVIRYFDDDNIFPETWAKFCKSQNVHPAIAESKSFRQMVFGHLNPGRIAKFQSAFLKQLVDEGDIRRDSLAFVSPDEFVVKYGPERVGITKTCEWLDSLGMEIKNWLNNGNPKSLCRVTPFYMSTILEDKKDHGYRLLKVYDSNGHHVCNKLFCVPGSKYHMYFKLYVLGEEPEQRDLYFYHEQKLAQWVY